MSWYFPWNIQPCQFQYLICSGCLIGNKTCVYEICKSLHSAFIDVLDSVPTSFNPYWVVYHLSIPIYKTQKKYNTIDIDVCTSIKSFTLFLIWQKLEINTCGSPWVQINVLSISAQLWCWDLKTINKHFTGWWIFCWRMCVWVCVYVCVCVCVCV